MAGVLSALGGIDRVLAILSWVAAAALVVMLFIGPELVAEDEPADGSPPAAEGGGGSESGGSDQEGADLFAENCGDCHTLEAAETSGAVGPPLDDVGLDSGAIAEIVSNGQGGMPSFADSLDDEQIQAIADFVADPSGS